MYVDMRFFHEEGFYIILSSFYISNEMLELMLSSDAITALLCQ